MPGTTNSEGVIAIIDSGIDHTHPDLQDSMYVIPEDLQKQLGCGKYGISVADDMVRRGEHRLLAGA